MTKGDPVLILIVFVVSIVVAGSLVGAYMARSTTRTSSAKPQSRVPATQGVSVDRRVAAAQNAKVNANLKAAIELSNKTMNKRVFTGSAFANGRCVVRVDTDAYDAESPQDQGEMDHLVIQMCAGSYTLIGGKPRSLPPDGLPVRVYDLAGNAVYSDTAVRSSGAKD